VADGSAPTILFVGTSLTAGYGLEPGQAFPARIQEKLDSLDLGYRVVNAGVAGEASAAARARVSSLLDEPFDVLVLETGAQDMLRRTAPDTIRANIAAIIAQVREARPHARIVLLGMMAPPFFDREYAEQFGALYTDLAREHELPIVPFLLLGVGGVPSLNLADGFHPNAEGQRVVARNVWEVLAPVLGAAVADSAAGPPVAVHLAGQDANSGRSAARRRPAAVAQPGGVAGTITEAGTGRPVDGARVWLEGTRISAMTGSHGRFMLRNVPAGEYMLHAQSTGYEESVTESVHIVAGATKSLDLQLKPAVFSLASIVVTPGRFGVMQENAAAPQTLGREAIETMPGLGEDIYRMVHRLPGVSADDYSARFAVRGGGNDEVLVRLDGLTLFEPFHLKDLDGALSIVDVQAVGGLELTTGGFTAEYGNRMTGIFDMHTLRRPAERRTSAGISLTNARFMGIGTFGGDRGHYLLSARRGYLDVLLNMIEPDAGFTPRYHDVLAKVEYQPSARHVVSLNVLSADDRLAMSDDHFSLNSDYGNHYAWLNWRMAPGDDLTAQTVVSVGRLDWGRNVAGGEAGTEITELTLDDRRDFTFAAVRQDWTWRISDSHLVKWGAAVRGSRTAYDYLREQDGEAWDGRPNSRRRR
jgi:lysophospholipase L1-like esterase